jgi:acetolactate synthase-1/2/3 large subunit
LPDADHDAGVPCRHPERRGAREGFGRYRGDPQARGREFLIGYPVNPIIEAAAEADIRTIMVRQERVGLHMADAVSRVTSGDSIGVFTMQHGPGSENAFGGIAQAYGDSSPIVVLPAGYPRHLAEHPPELQQLPEHQARREVERAGQPGPGRPGRDAAGLHPGPQWPPAPGPGRGAFGRLPGRDRDPELHAGPEAALRPDPTAVAEVARALVRAERPVILAGQGVHYAKAWPQLKELAELLEAPVTTTIQGKSAFPENHPLSLNTAGRSYRQQVRTFTQEADVIFGIGCSFATTNYGMAMPKGKTIIHATLDAADINKDVEANYALVGDAALTLDALLIEIKDELKGKPRGRGDEIKGRIKSLNEGWLKDWSHKHTDNTAPLSPYRVMADLLKTVDGPNTIITHDAGSPRDQLVPLWESTTPLSYIGWGKTTQLGYGLGLGDGRQAGEAGQALHQRLGRRGHRLHRHGLRDVRRERIPIMSVLLNNFSMAIELKIMQTATAKYRSTDISGNYADMAKAFGGYGERVTEPGEIIPAIKRGIQKTQEGTPVLLEFITQQETQISTPE